MYAVSLHTTPLPHPPAPPLFVGFAPTSCDQAPGAHTVQAEAGPGGGARSRHSPAAAPALQNKSSTGGSVREGTKEGCWEPRALTLWDGNSLGQAQQAAGG